MLVVLATSGMCTQGIHSCSPLQRPGFARPCMCPGTWSSGAAYSGRNDNPETRWLGVGPSLV